ncbi:TBC1 domain family member 1 like protein [Argiope bruennichi]|uniref:TBC1 domain family member 1 like protein n=1 Tax=Argiope bruennichi TaxID=94029 RepID=A0A8T0FSR8_ARGBR|nr:TBC1 domain family member 1 like protein [Argiope bruennichi]
MPKVEYSRLQDSDVELSSKYQRTFIARYYGRALVERWHTQPMLPWIIAEIQRLGSPKSETVFLSSDDLAVYQIFTVLKEAIQESSIGIKAKEDSPFDAVQSKASKLRTYGNSNVIIMDRFTVESVSQKRGPQRFVDDATWKLLSAKDSPTGESNSLIKNLDSKLSEEKENDWAFKETTDVVQHPLLIEEPGNGNSQKLCRQRLLSDNQNKHSLAPPSSATLITHSQSLDTSSRDALVQDIQTLAFTAEQFSSVIEDGSLHRQSSLPPMNAKTFLECSLGFPFTQEESSHSLSDDQNPDNRTMLFLISPCDIRLISTDKKELLFQKDFTSISHCSQGEDYADHFGIICRETTITGMDMYVGYIFQCQSAKIVNEIMKTLKQCFHCAVVSSHEKRVSSKIFNFCDTCPMYWFHKLCSDTEGESPEQIQSIVMMHIAALAEKEQKELMSKYQEIIVRSLAEQNIVFMTLLRALCEQKQMKHTHTVSKEHKEKRALSPLSNLTTMAKKTFPSTFDTVFKDAPLTKTQSLPVGARADFKIIDKKGLHFSKEHQKASKLSKAASVSSKIPPVDENVSKKDLMRHTTPPPKEGPLISFEPTEQTRKESVSLRNATERSLSDTAAVLWDLHQGEHQGPSQRKENMTTSDVKINELPRTPLKASPLRNIFLRVGSKKGNFPLKEIKEQHGSKGSWRKMLFNRVQRPFTKDIIFGEITEEKRMEVPKHSSAHLKALWKKAIMEQIILIRLEREQKKLKMKQDRILEKHTKLDYDVICPCPNDSIQKWDAVLNSDADYSTLESAVMYGVPRQKRGEIWIFLANKYCKSNKCPAVDNTPYIELLRKLTPYQHAILIDIGRTYPGHPYFKQVLGPGQLSLFSLLKAYSVVDEEVGYCQGLSFLGGILLLHVLLMDIEKSLLTYQIEYMVLKEEMTELNTSSEATPAMRTQIENENKDLQKQNMELQEQLQVALNTISKLEASVTSYQSTIRKLESHVRTLQDERDAMHHSVNILRKRLDSIDLASPPLEREVASQSDSVKNVKK